MGVKYLKISSSVSYNLLDLRLQSILFVRNFKWVLPYFLLCKFCFSFFLLILNILGIIVNYLKIFTNLFWKRFNFLSKNFILMGQKKKNPIFFKFLKCVEYMPKTILNYSNYYLLHMILWTRSMRLLNEIDVIWRYLKQRRVTSNSLILPGF